MNRWFAPLVAAVAAALTIEVARRALMPRPLVETRWMPPRQVEAPAPAAQPETPRDQLERHIALCRVHPGLMWVLDLAEYQAGAHRTECWRFRSGVPCPLLDELETEVELAMTRALDVADRRAALQKN